MSMDVDNELEGILLQQFSSLGTTDKEVLIAKFQELLGDQLNPPECAFYLDMNNWNLQAAICSYYDYQPSERLPKLTFLKDVTIGEGEAVPPNTTFTKTWKLGNSGEEVWPPGCQLKFCSGDNLASTDRVLVDALPPHSTAEISVVMRSPAEDGTYQAQWRMCTATGLFFGETIWVIVRVAEGGLLGVTQQLSRFGSDFVQNPYPESSANCTSEDCDTIEEMS
ncbi:protein ILRUN-like isoform X2 [Dreissena polymorpha]|uniref:protein ILRUN-like isoform X2 n=1 Tax=Dreissena polymorpha TaxID=45954 RepID=UPI00226407BB|nr:protein ILRUN-like isoform X2 [Dreissena polymorpha]